MLESANASPATPSLLAGMPLLRLAPIQSPERQVAGLPAPVPAERRPRRPAFAPPPRQVEPGQSGGRGQLV